MFTDVLRTSACCVSCWRGDQQGGQYDHAKHKRHLALRYRHFCPNPLRLPASPPSRRVLELEPIRRAATARDHNRASQSFLFARLIVSEHHFSRQTLVFGGLVGAQLAAAGSSLDRHEIAARPATSASDQRPRKHPCRDRSSNANSLQGQNSAGSLEICANLSKGYFATTFLSSSPLCR
jgi:hypothetical protein